MINVKVSEEVKAREAIKADAVIANLKTKTIAEIDTYIENKVVDLASAKEVLKTLAKVCVYQLKKDL